MNEKIYSLKKVFLLNFREIRNFFYFLKNPLKTTFAALLSVLISKYFNLNEGYWATITVIMVMQDYLGEAMQVGIDRAIATLIGGTLGIICLFIFDQGLLSFTVALLITLIICKYLKIARCYKLAGVTVAIVLLVHSNNEIHVAFARTANVVWGVLLSLLVSICWPSKARKGLQDCSREVFKELHKLFRLLSLSYKEKRDVFNEVGRNELMVSTKINKAEELVRCCKKEHCLSATELNIFSSFIVDQRFLLSRILMTSETFKYFEYLNSSDQCDAHLLKLLDEIDCCLELFVNGDFLENCEKIVSRVNTLNDLIHKCDKQINKFILCKNLKDEQTVSPFISSLISVTIAARRIRDMMTKLSKKLKNTVSTETNSVFLNS